MNKVINRHKIRKWIIVLLILMVLVVKITLTVQTTYGATDNALSYIENPAQGVTIIDKTKIIEFSPENAKTGIIFYPGALVEPDAYAPLMEKLAEQGIKCIIVRMPYYLAILDANGARGVRELYPEVENWYIAGHSLGGAMASMYGDIHSDEFKGIIFLASYPTVDMSDDDIDVLLVRGDQDEVLNMERYTESLGLLPENYQEKVIEGGCHAYFGDYGPQIGDGQPTITVEEQTELTVKEIVDFME